MISTVTVYEWSGGNLVQIATGGDCIKPDGTPAAGLDKVCATVNKDADPSTNVAPWPYAPKPNEGAAGFFPHGTFFEGGIDLTALGLTDFCFSTFLAETRSSTPFDSVLKDFVGPREFDTCKLEVTKNCTNPRLSGDQKKIIYDLTGKVTASGFGSSLFNVTLEDTPAADGLFQQVDCADLTTPVGSDFPLNSLSGEACYRNTMSVDLVDNAPSDTITATANTKADNSGSTLSAKATADCPPLRVNPTLSLTKTCRAVVEVVGSNVVAKVIVSGKVCNEGTAKEGNLTNVSVTDNPVTLSPLVTNITLAPQTCQNYEGSYYPSVANTADDKSTNCPSDVVFKDTVTAVAKDILGQALKDQTVSASCSLCPVGGCPAPAAP